MRKGELRPGITPGLSARNVQLVIRDYVAPGTALMSDEHGRLMARLAITITSGNQHCRTETLRLVTTSIRQRALISEQLTG